MEPIVLTNEQQDLKLSNKIISMSKKNYVLITPYVQVEVNINRRQYNKLASFNSTGGWTS